MWLICLTVFRVSVICLTSEIVILLGARQVLWAIVFCEWNGFNDYLLNQLMSNKKKKN